MRFDDDDDDPKKPRPVPSGRKRLAAPEAAEAYPPSHLFKDPDRDRHRHVT